MTAHWGLPDPADAEGSDAQIAVAFEDTYRRLKSRIEAFVSLPISTLDRPALLQQVRAIGELKLAPVAIDSPLFAAFKRHLTNAGLPTEDLQAEPSFYYALEPDGNDARAFGGLVSLGDDALLRSVVVPTEERGRGYGNVIVGRIFEEAAKFGAKNLWLLTTSADGFFEKQGWRTVKREDAPVSVTSTRQFSLICPSSAVLMCRAME
jgi:N-acetylglutamate synthase-like GNAT family acetyltransferase